MELNQEQNIEEDIGQKQNTDYDELAVSVQLKHRTYRSFRSILLRVLNLCLSSFYFGYCLGYFGSFDFEVIAGIFSIQQNLNTHEGFLQGCVPVGGGIGALASSILLKRLSRRNSLLFINSVAFLAGIVILVQNLTLLYVGRMMQGLCVGMYSALIPLLIRQFSPTELSGTLGALNQTFIATGVFLAYFIQTILNLINSQQEHWRICFGLTLITIVIQTAALLLIFPEQTPKYYLQNNQENSCRSLLEKIYQSEYTEKILAEKKKDLGLEVTSSPNQGLNAEKRESSKSYEMKQKNQGNTQEEAVQFSHGGRNTGKVLRTKVAIHLAILQQMVGINSVIAYGAAIAQQVIPSLKTAIPSLLNIQQIIATVLSSYFLSKFGRKVILQLGTFIGGVSLVLIAIGFILQNHDIQQFGDALIIIGLIIFMGNFGFSLGPIVWLYIAEIVQPQIIPFSTLSNWSAASLIIITFPILKNAFNSTVPLFLFYAVWTFISYFVNKKYVVQTKGKTQKQIFKEYNEL